MVPKSSNTEKTAIVLAPTPGAGHNNNNVDNAKYWFVDSFITGDTTTVIPNWPWNPRHYPHTTAATPAIIGKSDTSSGTALYNNPLPVDVDKASTLASSKPSNTHR
jgi:hypothetical protein